jgi:hypothetical protein
MYVAMMPFSHGEKFIVIVCFSLDMYYISQHLMLMCNYGFIAFFSQDFFFVFINNTLKHTINASSMFLYFLCLFYLIMKQKHNTIS